MGGTASGIERAHLFGVDVDALDIGQSLERAFELAESGECHQHVVLNAAKVVAMERDRELREVVAACSLVNADGASVVWASRLLRQPLPMRVTGIDLFERILERAAETGDSVYFLGAQPEVLHDMIARVRHSYPDLVIAGAHHGYWDDDEEVVSMVRASSPTFLFLAVPSPTKEFWLRKHLDELKVPFVMGVGGSFDVLSGHTRRAPRWMQSSGLEWLFRLLQEPRRLWRRYLYGNTAFVRVVVREWMQGR